MTMKGAFVAAAVAGMFAAAVPAVSSAAEKTAGVKCEGGNACNGKGQCKSATNACAGKNGCGGKGWVTAKDADDCKKLQAANKKK
jgi:hypothetical protein